MCGAFTIRAAVSLLHSQQVYDLWPCLDAGQYRSWVNEWRVSLQLGDSNTFNGNDNGGGQDKLFKKNSLISFIKKK